jgi:hypothetical protein
MIARSRRTPCGRTVRVDPTAWREIQAPRAEFAGLAPRDNRPKKALRAAFRQAEETRLRDRAELSHSGHDGQASVSLPPRAGHGKNGLIARLQVFSPAGYQFRSSAGFHLALASSLE